MPAGNLLLCCDCDHTLFCQGGVTSLEEQIAAASKFLQDELKELQEGRQRQPAQQQHGVAALQDIGQLPQLDIIRRLALQRRLVMIAQQATESAAGVFSTEHRMASEAALDAAVEQAYGAEWARTEGWKFKVK